MSIGISSETTIDLTKELLCKYDIHLVPFTVLLGTETKLDGEINNHEIFEFVKKSNKLPKTSAVNEYQYEEFFGNLLKKYDEIIHVGFSSELSSAYRNACNVIEEKFKGRVHIIDSRSLSTGIALLAIYAKELVNQGLKAIDIVNKVKSRVTEVQASFVLRNVDYLYKGGRCSMIAFLGANLFHICPQIILKDGKMISGKKYRGDFFNVVNNYVDDTLKQFSNPDLNHVFITYTELDDKDKFIKTISEKLTKVGFKNIHITTAGCTISSHCGPNCLGILYFNKNQ